MSELDADISSLFEETQLFLQLQARNQTPKNQPLTLRTEYKTNLKLTDFDKNVFEVDESFLSAFRDIYTDKAFKVVRLNNWELEIKFIGKRCTKIDLICESVTFLATKSIKREITACHFKIPIVQSEADLRKFAPEVHGYLNRLGKRNLCNQSQNVSGKIVSLLSFASIKPTKVQTFNYRPYTKQSHSLIDPLSTLRQEGKKILQKLRHFIVRQAIADYIVNTQVSEQSMAELRVLTVAKP